MPQRQKTVAVLLARYGRTYASELGIEIARNTPSPLFRLLCAALLFSARISAEIALKAARALAEKGWTTAAAMAGSGWEERTLTLNRAGYARYDESTSRMLGATAARLLDAYGGDLRRLRAAAREDPAEERRLLKEFKGIGDVGADIFFREAQAAWDELYPFADQKALQSALRLGLPGDAEGLARLVAREDFPRLAAALVRVALAKAHGEIEALARGGNQ